MATRQSRPRGTSLDVDSELVHIVQRAGRHSPPYRILRDVLEEGAVGTLTRLDGRGELLAVVRQTGNRLHLPVPASYSAHSGQIVRATAREASELFMHIDVLGGRWRPEAGMPLRDAFLLSCFGRFAYHYNRFWQQ